MSRVKNVEQAIKGVRHYVLGPDTSQRIDLLVIGLVAALSFSLFLGTSAFAASVYDNNYVTTNMLTVGATSSNANCSPTNLTNNWASYILDSSKWRSGSDFSAARTSLLAAFADETNGQWGVSQFTQVNDATHGNGYSKYVTVFWSQDSTAQLDWTSHGADDGWFPSASVFYNGTNVNIATIRCSDDYWGDEYDQPVVIDAYLNQASTGVIAAKSNQIGGWQAGSAVTWVSVSNLFVYNIDTNLPSGYEGSQVLDSPPPPRNYVALGDSFSSGEGNPPFESGTDIDSGSNKNICHRSASAYPHLLASSQYLNLTDFVACSGATTSNVINGGSSGGAWGEAPQVDALSQDTDIVTLTVGGNNVGFKDFATACTISLCDFSTQIYADTLNKITNDLPSDLADVYDAIDDETSNEARIYVLGYPNIVPPEMPTGASSACWPFNGGSNNPDPTLNSGAAAYAIQTQLNNTIQQAVEDFDSPKFQYVNPNESNSPFIGHDWCSQDRYFQVVALNQTSYSYHPNGLGHSAYRTVINREMD